VSLAIFVPHNCLLSIGTELFEKICSVIETISANILVNISSTPSDGVYLVGVLAVSGVVKSMDAGERGEQVIEVCFISTVSAVVSLFV
jgi:hypothetical protein